jgi:N-acetylmuramoyl-L-alanine amidase
MKESVLAALRKNLIFLIISFALFALAAISFFIPVNVFHTGGGNIVVDPGHGGIDGGTNKDGLLEKEINLAIAEKVRSLLVQDGYSVVMTREEDVSLDKLNRSSSSRHKRDLNARIDMINNSNAKLFVSIHVNCNEIKPATDGSIVFYGGRFPQSERLAYAIQRALNDMVVNDAKRTVRDPRKEDFSILRNAEVPGVLVETAFISNAAERKLLAEEGFRSQLAEAIAKGIKQYLKDEDENPAPGQTMPQ